MKKIAIIDDEKDIIDILEQLFNRSGKFIIETFTNPKNALQQSQNGDFDLILLDIMMPQMNGIEFLKEIKNSMVETKVVIMSAYATSEKITQCESFGADDFVIKPFPSLKILEEKVNTLLG